VVAVAVGGAVAVVVAVAGTVGGVALHRGKLAPSQRDTQCSPDGAGLLGTSLLAVERTRLVAPVS